MPRCHLLIVDDNPQDARLIELLIRELSLDVMITHVTTVAEGLDAAYARNAHAGAAPPSLMLVDLHLPVQGGRELLDTVKGDPELRIIPVVAISGSVRPEDAREAYELGANAYMRKPLNLDELTSVVSCFAHFWLRTADLPDACSTEIIST